MKVLFAVNNDKIAETITKKYQEEYKEIISGKTVYYFNAIIKELQKDKTYDRIVISEDLEMFANDNYQAIDKFIFEKMDAISDEATNIDGNDIPIILLVSDRRTKNDPLLIKLFGLGIYGVLVGQDRSITKVCNLIYKPRGKKEAKQYYKVEPENVNYASENSNEVSENEIQNILYHYKKIGNNATKCVNSFDSIYSQYSEEQVRIIAKMLPPNVKSILEENSEKYREVMGIKGKISKTYSSAQQEDFVEKEISSGNRLSKPIIIPTAVNTKNVIKVTEIEDEKKIAAKKQQVMEEKRRAEAEARRKEERIAREKAKAEAEARRKEEERIAREKAKAEAEARRKEEERIAREKAKAEAEARRKEEERIAREKAKAEAEARRKEEERIAREKAKAEAEARRKEEERITKEKAVEEKKKKENVGDKMKETNLEQAPKRGRGRPHKTEVVEQTPEVIETKRKRGRPRKETVETIDEKNIEKSDKKVDEKTANKKDIKDIEKKLSKTNKVEEKINEDEDILVDAFEDFEDLIVDESNIAKNDEELTDDDDLFLDEDFEDDDLLDEKFEDGEFEEEKQNEEDENIIVEDDELLDEDLDDIEITDDELLDEEYEDDVLPGMDENEEITDDELLEDDFIPGFEDDESDEDEFEDFDIIADDITEETAETDDILDIDDNGIEDSTDEENEENEENEESEDVEEDEEVIEQFAETAEDDDDILPGFEDYEDEENYEDDEVDENHEDDEEEFDFIDDTDDMFETEDNIDDFEDTNDIDVSEESTAIQHNGHFGGINNKNYQYDNNLADSIKGLRETEEETTDYNVETDHLITSDQKIISFVGTTKNGTSFIVNHLAELYSSQNIKTAVLDLTQNKNSFYIYTNNEEELRQTAQVCFEKLRDGRAEGINVNKNLTVFTSLPGEDEALEDVNNIIQTLLQNYTIVLLDCDFETDEKYFKVAQEIYLVQSLDVLTIQPLTAFLRDLKVKGILQSNKLRIIINKDIKVSSISDKILIGGMSVYNDPGMTYMTELFDKEKIKYTTIPFDNQVYIKYLESMVNCKISLRGYPKHFMNSLNKLADVVYPTLNGKSVKKLNDYSKRNKKYENAFSQDVNTTLEKMKKNY